MSLFEQLTTFVEPLKRRILLMTAKALVKAVNDAGGIQTMQITALAEESRDVERYQDYGLSTHPPTGSQGIILFLGGDRSHGIAIKVDDPATRKKGLTQGEVALYTDEGDYLWLKRNREALLRANKFNVIGSSETLMDLVIDSLTEISDGFSTLSGDSADSSVPGVLKPLVAQGSYSSVSSAIDALIAKLEAMKADA
jgi:phage baseplate assembly protein V